MANRTLAIEVEKQFEAQACWIAAGQAVLKTVIDGFNLTQAQLKNENKQGDRESGNLRPLLEKYNALARWEKINENGDDGYKRNLFGEVRESINRGIPVVCNVHSAGEAGFKHALVIIGYRDPGHVTICDPGFIRTDQRHRMEVNFNDVLCGLRLYGEYRDDGLRIYTKRIYFPQRPAAASPRRGSPVRR